MLAKPEYFSAECGLLLAWGAAVAEILLAGAPWRSAIGKMLLAGALRREETLWREAALWQR